MKTSNLVTGDILAQEKDSYGSGKPVMVLDSALWTLGNEWVSNPMAPGTSTETYSFRPAKTGERAGNGTYRSNYRSTGVPVLMVEQGYYRWMDSRTPDNQIATSAQDILRAAAKQLGAESAEDLAGHKAKGSGGWRTEVVAEMSDGTKISVSVVLTTVRPQTLVGAWNTFLNGKNQEQAYKIAYEAKQEIEANRRKEVSSSVADRLDALLGETKRHWRGVDRDDCYRSDGGFQVSEATLLRLLELAEKSASQ
jgi:hypothetical protein